MPPLHIWSDPTHPQKIQRRLPQTVSPPSSSFLSPQFLWTPSHSLSPHSSVTLLVPNTWSSTSSSLSIKEIKNKPHHQEERIKSHLPCPFSSRKAQKKTKCQQRCSDTRALATRMRARRLIWRQGMERLCTQVWVLERTSYDGAWFAKFMASWLLSLSSPPSSLLLRFYILLSLISSGAVLGSLCFYQLFPLFVSTQNSRSLLSPFSFLFFFHVIFLDLLTGFQFSTVIKF